MRIYFTVPYRTKEEIEEEIKKIILYTRSSKNTINDISPIHDLKDGDIDGSKRVAKYIKEADAVIAELSTPSSGVGFEIALALIEKKPVLVLVRNDKKEALSGLLKNSEFKNLKLRTYNNLRDIEFALDIFFGDVSNQLESKFNFIIPAELDSFLEWCTKKQNKSKSEIAREALKTLMNENIDYKNYLDKDSIEL